MLQRESNALKIEMCLEQSKHGVVLTFFFDRAAILVPPPGIEPAPPTLEAQSLNHWTAR